jgi:hypothetical protein
MIWVGSFKPLQSVLAKLDFTGAPLAADTWVRSEIGLISPLVDWLIGLIAAWRCVLGDAQFVELALREALSNAMLHGNRLDAGGRDTRGALGCHSGRVHRRRVFVENGRELAIRGLTQDSQLLVTFVSWTCWVRSSPGRDRTTDRGSLHETSSCIAPVFKFADRLPVVCGLFFNFRGSNHREHRHCAWCGD